ncbi:MAG: transglycosylase SLT domain-containing protein [Candidatus Latescibacteria bacterium]|nr:transglycosylase SLT domain-containing protein [Candidatus Latescibacterota bacterium]
MRIPILIILLMCFGCADREGQHGLDQDSEQAALSPIRADSVYASPSEEQEKQLVAQPSAEEEKELCERKISRYDHLVRKYAKRYGFDCRLILAQIKHESEFDPNAVSPSGARGLMQIMPFTARSLGVKNPHDPRANIAAGVRYLRKQYDIFKKEKGVDRLCFALASYHAGFGHVVDAQKIAEHLLLRPDKWGSIKVTLPKLTLEYKSMHRTIWGVPRPKYGFYYGAVKTIAYVENIKRTYGEYRKLKSL